MARLLRAWLLIPLAVVWISFAGYARAVEVQAMYRAEAPVATQDSAEREQAFRATLETVLIRASGRRDIVDQPKVKELLVSASRYVQQYGYQDTQEMTLWVQFDGGALRAALNEANLPVWVDERPAVLIWLAVVQGDNRYLIDEDSRKEARKIIQAVAAQRGLPILLPLLDIEDRTRIDVADVIAGFDDVILEASTRYGADALLIARATELRDNFWRAQWRLRYSGQTWDWDFQESSLEAVLTQGMHTVADALGERLAVVESMHGQGQLLMLVDGVDSLEDYAALRNYLDSMALVRSYRAHRVGPGQISFWLQLTGAQVDVRRVIDLGNVLEQAPVPEPSASKQHSSAAREETPVLHYRLLR